MKRKVLALILLLGLFFCQAGFSQDYNVLIFPQNTQLSTYITSFFPTKLVTENLYASYLARYFSSNLKASGEALAKAYDSEVASEIEAARQSFEAMDSQASSSSGVDLGFDVGASLDVALVSFSDSSLDMSNVISSKDLLTLDYISSTSKADLILIPLIGELAGFKHLALYAYSVCDKSLSLVYEELSQSSSEFSLQVLLRLGALFDKNDVSVLTFDGLVQGSSVTVDGSEVTLLDSTLVLTSGPHTFDIALTGYETKHLKTNLETNTVSTLFVEMNKVVYDSLEVTSTPSATVSFDGAVLGTTPYTITGYTLPLLLNFSADGYVNKTVSLNSETKSISVSLKPTWLNDEASYEKARNRFYNSFARSLVIFGLKIVSKSFSSNYNEFWMAANTVCSGALFLSLTDLAGNLINYYKYSEYVSP